MSEVSSFFSGGIGIAVGLFLVLWAIVTFFLPFYVMAIHTKSQKILQELKSIKSQLKEGITVYPAKPGEDGK